MSRNILLIAAALLLILLVVSASFSLLPAAPIAPTPTWPKAVELPNKLQRITQP